LLCACAPRVSMRVPSEAVAELPLERRLTLLDAENDLLAATDAVDARQEQVDEIPALREQAEERKRAAGTQEQNGHDSAAVTAMHEGEARVDYLEHDAEVRRANLHVAQAALLVAQARFEEARATEVEAAALPGSRGVRRAEYHEQVERLAKVQAAAESEAAKTRASAAEAEKKWRAARAELTRQTGGAQGSAWVQ